MSIVNYNDNENELKYSVMYKLPYILIDKSELVPLPGNSYYLELNKNTGIETESFVSSQEVYLKAFAFLIQDNSTVLNFGTICTINEQNLCDGKLKLSFSCIRKIESIERKTSSECSFYLSKTTIKKDSFQFVKLFIENAEKNPNLKQVIDTTGSIFSDIMNINRCLDVMEPSKDLLIRYLGSASWFEKLCVANLILNEYNKGFEGITPELKKQNNNKPIVNNHIKEKIAFEKKRLSGIPASSAEHSSTQDYLHILENIPWGIQNEETIDVEAIKTQLNESHYGLDKIKAEILDFYALKQLTGVDTSSPFLLSGPPGTGKTTIVKAIAKATGRDFITIALGGVSDESEFRGHRRTYVGARPGRIISALAKCKSSNPIILLDEIDKISNGAGSNKGDPFGALLELLDPEQNKGFIDRFLEIPIDLSKCTFFCTANEVSNIPLAVMDRLDEIKFVDYTPEQKSHIIKNYIFNKIKTNYNMNQYAIELDEKLIEFLSEEFNLRKINREIERIFRKSATKILSGKEVTVVTMDDYDEMDTEEIQTQQNKPKKRIGFCL